MKISEKLFHLRKEKKLTIKKLSDCSGVAFGALSDIENGKNLPSLPTLIKLSTFYGITLSELLEDIEK